MAEKSCSTCGVTKPLSDFYPQKRGKFGVKSKCKKCDAATNKIWREQHKDQLAESVRKWRAKNPERVAASERKSGIKKHGMTIEQFDALFVKQGGACAICAETDDGRRLSVDHDHSCCPGVFSCGECVRGLLCKHCNYAIGHFRNSVEIMQEAIEYLS